MFAGITQRARTFGDSQLWKRSVLESFLLLTTPSLSSGELALPTPDLETHADVFTKNSFDRPDAHSSVLTKSM
jgi:hypothetical protein